MLYPFDHLSVIYSTKNAGVISTKQAYVVVSSDIIRRTEMLKESAESPDRKDQQDQEMCFGLGE